MLLLTQVTPGGALVDINGNLVGINSMKKLLRHKLKVLGLLFQVMKLK